ncbi:general transcription factor IIH subunit 1 isoform X2 [Anthonomus grandis grandis]|uniref:general transcription factor IIH subunit 1 isoform X2 n=1 Tax=Anthonomus grandis grandis TaxID=2921223 RepID=UPI0021651C21|nr:general transcription factor IIH subunit 1 isoform X2 [Anthonomus grandis grandis]
MLILSVRRYLAQKISPEGKAKVQLQVVLHNGVSSTFHFTNTKGLQAQLADRDKIKDMLQTLLPKFKRKVDKELEEKNNLLSTNPILFQLYKDLVMTEVVSSEEFWTQHAQQHLQKKKQAPQEIGVSGAFLADIKPQTDGCNGLKYNITPDIIECIFKTYPAVKKKYLENVPNKLTEAQFWTKFFQSHYFHRDRKYAENKDLFTECGKIDDQELKKDIQAGVKDPLVNLTEFEDKTLEEGYGTSAEKPSSTIGTASQAMIKRFNQHSIMVLKATKNKAHDTQSSEGSQQVSDSSSFEAAGEPINKKQKILEKITYDDLEGEDNQKNGNVHLNLSKVERYLHGPMPDAGGEHINSNESAHLTRSVLQEARQWQARPHAPNFNLVTPSAAIMALGDLSPGGALMRGFQEQSLAQLVPPHIEKDLRNLYLALCELLSHFWKAFPPTTPNGEQHLIKMNEALQRFQTVKLKPFEAKLIRELTPLSQQLTKHLNQLLNAAYQKFSTWQKMKAR